MIGANSDLNALTRSERRALRALLVHTIVDQSRLESGGIELMLQEAPVHALPAAAALHRVSGLVRRGLEGVDGVPDAVQASLEASERRAILRHLVIVGALSDIGRAFDEAHLRWVTMKGPVVAALLYGGVGERTYSDLDLLVDHRDFAAAMGILEDLAYRHSIRDWALAEQMLAGQVELTNPAVHVDLHWHLHYSREDRRPFALDPDAMVGRARRVDVSGVGVPTLDPVDTLLTLAFHAARSDGHRLIWLKDVERSIVVDSPDLDELVRRCRNYRCGGPVGLILARARNALAARIPDDVVNATTPRGLRAVDRVACAAIDPIQFHDRPTVTRAFTRSVRSSLPTSIAHVPARAARWATARARPPRPNETDDPGEKASYLRAVASSAP